jgi:hypothetical protein
VAETRTCPTCKQPVLVRVGIIERHAKPGQHPWAMLEEGRPRLVEWCAASNRRWDEVAKKG